MHLQRIPQLYLLANNFNFYILQFFRAFNFLYVLFSFAKNFVIPSICQNAKESILNKILFYNLDSSILDCFTFVRNDNYFYLSLRGIGNAEAIKFTFDSLSRKIKIPCLVINILS